MIDKEILDKVKRIHFIGIGGSGMCPMAEILNEQGFEVTGSDVYESDTLERIKRRNIPVFMGHKEENILGAELVVYSAAIKQDNPEIVAAKEKNIPTIERSVMLGLLTQRYKNSVAISGTHGKTSTTAMITQVLIGSKLDPTAIIGGTLPLVGGNSHIGKSDTIVCEACEYVDSFLKLSPSVSIILNIDADHLDYFKNLDNIKKSFRKFAEQTSDCLVVNGDDKNTLDAIDGLDKKVITYGFNENNDYYAKDISTDHGIQSKFLLMHNGEELGYITLNVPGRHNIYNALAAITTCHYLGASISDIADSLEKFTGVHRRFEILGKRKGVVIADDFAHHPTELRAVLNSAMSMGFKRVWAVFQPHTYSRTFLLMDDFAKALSIADRVIISEILPVRETNTYNVTSQDLGDKIENCVCIDTFEDITDYISENAKEGDLVLTIGGGNVYKCANMILDRFSN